MAKTHYYYKMLVLIITLLFLLSLSACNSSASEKSQIEEPAVVAPIVGECIMEEAAAPEVPGLNFGKRAEGFAQLPGSHQANPLLDKLNPELEYIVYSYEVLPDDASQDAHFSNLTGTKVWEEWPAYSAFGWRILTSAAELAEYDAILEAEKSDASPVTKQEGTAELSFDEAFFAEHRLLLVDLCMDSASEVLAYPATLEADGNIVTMQFRFDASRAIGPDAGQIFLIVIPADCNDAVVNIIPSVGFAT